MINGVAALLFCAAVVLEALAGNLGLMPPVVAVCAYCMTVRAGLWRSVVPALLAAAFTDALWCHEFPSRICAVLLCVGVAASWRTFGAVHSWGGLAVSALASSLSSWLGAVLGSLLAGTSFVGWRMLFTQLLWCLLLLPMVAKVLDLCMQRRLTWYSVMTEAEPEDDDEE